MSEPKTGVYAEVIADSVAPTGERLTTMEVQCHRFVLAEFNTHRKFSRNSASSRAIPARKQLDRVENDPALPVVWPAEQRGMQGGEPLDEMLVQRAEATWLEARNEAVNAVSKLVNIGVHKSVTNRLLEPFMWHRIIVSSTEWDNFFSQRCSPLAQPEIRLAAEAMHNALAASRPQHLETGEWHVPYIDDATRNEIVERSGFIGTVDEPWDYPWKGLQMISAARCARVSYLTHDGVRDLDQDLELYSKLSTAKPPHWSPLEHVATPGPSTTNFDGWVQMRQQAEA